MLLVLILFINLYVIKSYESQPGPGQWQFCEVSEFDSWYLQ